MGFGQGLSGLKGASQKLDVIGNNIANSGTVGFKSSTVSFADVYASSRVGLGTQVAAVNQNFGIGNISSTGGQFDMAIDGDRGLFRVVDTSGQVMYTRNGEFTVNKEGYLVNPQGYFVTGYIGESTTPERIRIPYGNIAPKATTDVDLESNFNSKAPAVPLGATEKRGWIEMVLDTEPVGTPAKRYYYQYKWDSASGGTGFSWTDSGGTVLTAPNAGIPGDGAYRSGNQTVQVATTATDGFTAPIPSGAAFEQFNIPISGERIGSVTLRETLDPNDPGANAKPYYYKIVEGEFVWLNANGGTDAPLLVPGPAAPGPATTYYSGDNATMQFEAGGKLVGGGTEFPDGTAFTAYMAEPVTFDPLVPGSFSHSLPMTVYDSLGGAHQLTQYFVKREANSSGDSVWNVFYRLDGERIDEPMFDGAHEMTFDSSGLLKSPKTPFTINFSVAGGNSPAERLTLNIDYAGSTQFEGGFTPDFLQNGYATGEYSSMTFSSDGSMVASYTNGVPQKIGTIVLAHFNNLQGMKPVGGNAWIETADSGPAILGTPNSMGFAGIKGQAVEESNVDMGTELVNLIITQRTYQANAQTISAQNEILQTLINMR